MIHDVNNIILLNMDDLILELYYNYINHNKLVENLNSVSLKKIRRQNFPECISEYIIYKHFLKLNLNIKFIQGGDLKLIRDTGEHQKIEVKCTTKRGLISFGPKETWTHLAIITFDSDENFSLYYSEISSNDEVWLNLKINKTETFSEQSKQKRRPRINFKNLCEQIDFKIIFQSKKIDELLK